MSLLSLSRARSPNSQTAAGIQAAKATDLIMGKTAMASVPLSSITLGPQLPRQYRNQVDGDSPRQQECKPCSQRPSDK